MNTDEQKRDILKLFDDALLDTAKENDAFGHQTYANILTRVFEPSSGNRPGLSVALFGNWGQGKSSVVRMMQKNFAEERHGAENSSGRINIIWFNAWKSRGDHVRRQLLLSIIKGIDSPKYDAISKFTRPGIPLEIRSYEEQRAVSEKASIFTMARKEPLGVVEGGAVLFAILSLVVWLVSQFIPEWTPKLAAIPLFTFFTSSLVYVWHYFSARKESILTSAEPVSDSQRLKYPDQFQKVFEEELADYKRRDARPIVVVVDDLDRCEAGTVVEALACIRQLGGETLYEKNIADCRFLVPCDDKQVVSALTADGHHAGYEEDELLRKFFDVVIRMDEFVPEDMVSYARQVLSQEQQLDQREVDLIQELVGSVAPHNPREVKKLINAFLISGAKLDEAKKKQTFRQDASLKHLDRTRLLAVAFQETVPDVYARAVENPEYLIALSKLKVTEETPRQTKRAKQILSALQPISTHSFRLIVRKGLPESLKAATRGQDVYDAVTSGDADLFKRAVSGSEDLSTITAWLRQYRTTIQSTSQLRHVFTCLSKDGELPSGLSGTVEIFLQDQRLSEAIDGFDGLIDLAGLSTKLHSGKRELHNAIISNLRKLVNDDLLVSNELKAIFTCAKDLSLEARSLCASKLIPLFNTGETKAAQQRLEALNGQLDSVKGRTCTGIMPSLALAIAKDCSWGIYSTKAPDMNKGLHSRAIADLIDDNADDQRKLLSVLFGKNGPLATPIGLQQDSTKGENEGLLTLERVAGKMSAEVVQDLYIKLTPWIKAQPDAQHDHFRRVCNAFGKAVFQLTDKQLGEFAVLLADRTMAAGDPEWLCEYVEKTARLTEQQNHKYTTFCKSIFTHVAKKQLTTIAISEPLRKLLRSMAEHKWDISEDADALFASAISSRITDQPSWLLWKAVIWPLCKARCPKTTQAVNERIKLNVIPAELISFAVVDICNMDLSHTLQSTLKEYFKLPRSLANKEFTKIFEDHSIKGASKVLEFAIDDLSPADISLDESQIKFLVDRCPAVSAAHLMKCIRVRYLQSGDPGKFSIGLGFIHAMGNPPSEIVTEIRKYAKEQADSLTTEEKVVVTELLREDIFEKSGK